MLLGSLYIELLTRISTQYLQPVHGDEKTALDSIHNLFSLTREILKSHGRDCQEFAKIAIPILNQIVRPSPRSGTASVLLEPSQMKPKAPHSEVSLANFRRYFEIHAIAWCNGWYRGFVAARVSIRRGFVVDGRMNMASADKGKDGKNKSEGRAFVRSIQPHYLLPDSE
jgi:hypothetical protein